MATTVAVASVEVASRLFDTAGTGPVPDDTKIQDYIRWGFEEAWRIAPPVFRGEFTVADAAVAGISADLSQVHFVHTPRFLLFPGAEYTETATGINLLARANRLWAEGDDLLIFYSTVPDFSAAATIDSTCVFGPEWLEQFVIFWAMEQSLMRQTRRHQSGGSLHDGNAYVTVQRERHEMERQLVNQRAVWFESKRAELSAQLAMRKPISLPTIQQPNRSRLRNTLVRRRAPRSLRTPQ